MGKAIYNAGTAWLRGVMTTLSWRKAAPSSCCPTVPQGLSVASEVQKRLTLWEERSFEALLQRAEEQFLLKRKAGKRRKTSGPA